MAISYASIKKLFREHFQGETQLHLPRAEREAWLTALKERFDGDEWIDTVGDRWMPQDRRARHLLTFILKDPERPFYYSSDSFHLMLDEEGRVVIEGSSVSAPVSHLDEVLAFVVECKRRLERQRAMRKRREKVRGFKNAAMTAQLREIARQEGFEFMVKYSPQRITLWVRLTKKDNALEIHFAPKRFQELLARLPSVVRSLRESWEAGVTFKTVTRRALPWDTKWIRPGDAAREKGSGSQG